MRRVEWRDPDGLLWMREIPDAAPDGHAAFGVPVGPPRLGPLGLPADVAGRLHNQLYHRGILTVADARRRPDAILAAITAALRLSVQAVQAVYEGLEAEAAVAPKAESNEGAPAPQAARAALRPPARRTPRTAASRKSPADG